MKLINPYFEIIEQEPTIEGMYKQIELVGRTCYKSEDKITVDSAKEFVDRMIASGHGAMLEHGTVYLKLNRWLAEPYICRPNQFSRIVFDLNNNVYITTNLRVLVENGRLEDLEYWCYDPAQHAQRYTVKWHCSRGIDDEFFRHRSFSRTDNYIEFSYGQESTRYCNYSKDKFSNEVVFVIPREFSSLIAEGHYDEDTIASFVDKNDNCPASCFLYAMLDAESQYLNLVNPENNKRVKPQVAREVLPLAVKSDLNMTGYIEDWNHFFELRTDNAAHPDARYLADALMWEFYKRNYFDEK